MNEWIIAVQQTVEKWTTVSRCVMIRAVVPVPVPVLRYATPLCSKNARVRV